MIAKVKKLILCSIILTILTTITLNLLNDRKSHNANPIIYKKEESNELRILCMILTSEKTIVNRCPILWMAWASKCKQTYFFLNSDKLMKAKSLMKEGKALSSEYLPFRMVVQLPVYHLDIEENYKKMSQKVLLVLKKAYEEFSLKFDWFFLTDDDTFAFVSNLEKFASSKDFREPFVYGYNFKAVVQNGYQSGGAGQLFSLESLKRLHASISQDKCQYIVEHGDVATGLCMMESNVSLGNSLDSKGRERFHPMTLEDHYYGKLPDWLIRYSQNPVKSGKECCSEDSITFHYIENKDMLELAFKNRFRKLLKP